MQLQTENEAGYYMSFVRPPLDGQKPQKSQSAPACRNKSGRLLEMRMAQTHQSYAKLQLPTDVCQIKVTRPQG